VRDSDRIIGLLASKSRRAEPQREAGLRAPPAHPLFGRAGRPRRDADRRGRQGDPLGAAPRIIPESETVLRASNTGTPVILDTESPAGRAYDDAVARLLGETRELRFLRPERRSLFRTIFGRA